MSVLFVVPCTPTARRLGERLQEECTSNLGVHAHVDTQVSNTHAVLHDGIVFIVDGAVQSTTDHDLSHASWPHVAHVLLRFNTNEPDHETTFPCSLEQVTDHVVEKVCALVLTRVRQSVRRDDRSEPSRGQHGRAGSKGMGELTSTCSLPQPCASTVDHTCTIHLDRIPRDVEFESREAYAQRIADLVVQRDSNVPTDSPVFQPSGTQDMRVLDDAAEMAAHARLGRPFMLRGVTQGWSRAAHSLEGLLNVAADEVFVLRKPSAETGYGGMDLQECTLREYVDAIASSADPSRMHYCANNFLPPCLIPHVRLPSLPFLAAHEQLVRMLDTKMWIGPHGTGAPLHRDLQDNFVVCLFGEKEFKLLAPRHSEKLHIEPVTPFLQSGKPKSLFASQVDSLYISVRLKPGDGLWLPTGWWHGTSNTYEGVTCTINYWLSACFLSLGVALPCTDGLVDSDWLVEPGTVSGEG